MAFPYPEKVQNSIGVHAYCFATLTTYLGVSSANVSLYQVRHNLSMKLINIGFGNIVSASRVVAIVSPESAPIKRTIGDAREAGLLIDATYGRRTRAVIIVDSGHVVLSAIQPETIANRFMGSSKESEP